MDVDRLRESDVVDFVVAYVWMDDWMDSDDEFKFCFFEWWIWVYLVKFVNDKFIVFEEFGKKWLFAVRDAYFARIFEFLREDDCWCVGVLFWLFFLVEIEDYDGFIVYDVLSDVSMLNIVCWEIEFKAVFFRGEGVDVCCVECVCVLLFVCDDGDMFNDDDINDDDIVIEFLDDGNDEIYVDVFDEIESFVCRMATSNAYEVYVMYGDYVFIELDIEIKVLIDVFVDFIIFCECMFLMSVWMMMNKDGDWCFALTFVVIRRLGDDGVYVDEGLLCFCIDVVFEMILNEWMFFVEGVIEGVIVVFDFTASFVVDAYFRSYVRDVLFCVDVVWIGDIVVLYVLFSEFVDDVCVWMCDCDVFVSLVSYYGDAFYGYVEILRVAGDVSGDEVMFEIFVVDCVGNMCFICVDVKIMDESLFVVVDVEWKYISRRRRRFGYIFFYFIIGIFDILVYLIYYFYLCVVYFFLLFLIVFLVL